MQGKEFGQQGSGYPADPYTKQFLSKCMQPVFGFPTFVRFSWSTIPKMLKDQNGVVVQWKEDLEDSGAPLRSSNHPKKKRAKSPSVLMKLSHIQENCF